MRKLALLYLLYPLLLVGLPVGILSAQEQEDEDDNIYELSPFSVDESEDVGYYSSQTLAGGRLKSDLKDVATTVQVVTQEMLEDIGATQLEEVLVYTTNTDIVGAMSSFGSLGESGANGADGALTQGEARENPHDANRVRGLASATRTTNYFQTSIPFDRYNSGRLDINRGANSFLFGLGSPGGIINNSLEQAEFRDSVELNVQFSTEDFENNYSKRGSVNLNKVLVEDKLAMRIALMESEREFMQRPAYTDDSRQYIALKFKPFEDHHVVLNANFETGDVTAVPVDRVAPTHTLDTFLDDPYGTVWGSAGTVTNAAGRRVTDIFGNILLNGADPTYNVGYLGTDINGVPLNRTLYDKFLKRNGWAVVYDGYEDAQGVAGRGIDTGWTNNNIWAGSPTFGDGLSGNREAVMGRNIRLSEINEPAYDGYVPSGLTNWDVFDARKHLISGSIDNYTNDFDRNIISLEAVTDDGNYGIDVSYAREAWTRDSYVATSNPVIDIDTNYSFPTGPSSLFGPTNPNFGKLYFFAQLANQTKNVDKRETKRVTAFAKIDFEDKFDSGILKWFGSHILTGLYDDHTLDEKHFLDTPAVFGNNADFELRNEAVIFQRLWSGIFYISDPFLQAYENPGFQLSDFSTIGLPQDTTVSYPPGHQMPIAYLKHGDPAIGGKNAGANRGAEVSAESTFTNAFIPFRGVLTKTNTESKALNMQSRFFDDLLIANLGWREDEVSLQRNSNPPIDPVSQIPDRDPSGFNLDTIPVEVDSSNIFSYGLVFHTPSDWMPEGTNLSFHYGESENFVPNPGGFTLEGEPVPGSSGDTEEMGFTIGLMDNKLVARFNAYKGTLRNEQFTPLGRAFTLFGNRDVVRGLRDAWLAMDQYDRNRDGLLDEIADPDNPGEFIDSDVDDNGLLDRIEAIDPRTGLPGTEYVEGARYLDLAQLTKYYEGFENFVSPWARGQAPLELGPPGTISGDNSDAGVVWGQGLQDALSETTDLVAEGLEFELTYNPISNLRIALNVTKQEARRSNIAPNLGRYFEDFVAFVEAAGPDGPRIRTGSNLLTTPLATEDYATNTIAGRPLRAGSVGGNYFKQVALEGSDNPEVRKYRVNILGNYSFTEGRLSGFNVGGAFRWQDEAAIGYPVIYQEAFGASVPISDVSRPYFDNGFEFFDAWIGYRSKIFDDKVDWRIQLNIRNVFADSDPVPIQTQPDGTIARVSIPVPRQFVLSNTFSF